MNKMCEALGDFLMEFYKVNRFKGTPKYDEVLQTIGQAFSYKMPYDAVAIYLIDNGIPLKPVNIIKFAEEKGLEPVEFDNEDTEYKFVCKNVFMFLTGILGISRIKNKKKRLKLGSILLTVLSVDTLWSAVWTLFLSRGDYSLKSLIHIVLDVVFDEMNISLSLVQKVKVKKIGKNNYTLVLKVSKEYVKIVDAKKHSKLKDKLGRILIEL